MIFFLLYKLFYHYKKNKTENLKLFLKRLQKIQKIECTIG